MSKWLAIVTTIVAVGLAIGPTAVEGQSPSEAEPLVPVLATVDATFLDSLSTVVESDGSQRYANIATVIVSGTFNSGGLADLATGLSLVSDTTFYKSEDRQLVVNLPDAELDSFLAAASELPGVLAADVSTIRFIQTNDPGWLGQQLNGLHLVDLEGYASLLGDGSPDVTVAVMDTGVDHIADLAGRVDTGINYTTTGPVNDEVGHGTQIASIIAGEVNNGIGVAGIAPDVRILPIQVCHQFVLEGFASCPDIYINEGLYYALGEAVGGNLDVLNLSLGGPSYNSYQNGLICDLLDQGVTVVAASGNSGTGSAFFPASSPCAVAVAGLNSSGSRHPDSNYGSAIDVAAPMVTFGVNPNGSVQVTAGTSFAAPVISGLAALYRSGSFREFYWEDLFLYQQPHWNSQVGNGVPNWALKNMRDTACNVYDFNGNRWIDLTDAQMIAARYGAFQGSRHYSRRFDIEDAEPDGDIDIVDISKLFGRYGFTCLPE